MNLIESHKKNLSRNILKVLVHGIFYAILVSLKILSFFFVVVYNNVEDEKLLQFLNKYSSNLAIASNWFTMVNIISLVCLVPCNYHYACIFVCKKPNRWSCLRRLSIRNKDSSWPLRTRHAIARYKKESSNAAIALACIWSLSQKYVLITCM